MKIVIRAGGIGARLWPYSRKNRPKPFHAFVGGQSMIQTAVARVASLAGPDDLYVSTGVRTVARVREQLVDLPEDHLFVEPAIRNTGPAVGLECALLEARYPGCTVASLGSDHHVGRPDEFRRLLRVAEAALEEMPETLFTIGVKPTAADTGLGYIQVGDPLGEVLEEPIFEVKGFTEKPDEAQARAYVHSGEYLWNSNMFAWKARTMLDLFSRFEPEIYDILDRIHRAAARGNEAEVIANEYPKMKDIPIDSAILERAQPLATLKADIDWSDIGTWGALGDLLPKDREGNLLSGDVLALDTHDVTAYAPDGKLIALIDVEDLVVIDTSDALLICPRDRTQRVKDVVNRLSRERNRERYT